MGNDLISEEELGKFQGKILDFYRTNGRTMAWREDTSPFSIYISEVMLQQTQVSRVGEYYTRFTGRFAGFCALAQCSLQEMLIMWQGLGYNRRAKYLLEASKIICREYAGMLPADPELLQALPGIGPNTAGSICAFAFNMPVVFIETNIRRVFLREFFSGEDDVPDRRILPLIGRSIPPGRSRVWYWALMDYGAHLKSLEPNANRRSRHYSRQSKFEGSARQLRSAILRTLTGDGPLDVASITSRLKIALPDHAFDERLLQDQLNALCNERFIRKDVAALPGNREDPNGDWGVYEQNAVYRIMN